MNRASAPRGVYRATRLILVLACVWLAAGSALAAQQPKTAAGDQPVPLNQLADMLENDDARAQLIAELRRAAQQQSPNRSHDGRKPAAKNTAPNEPAAANAAGERAKASRERASFARRFARTTAGWAQAIGAKVTATWAMIASLNQKRGPGPTFDAAGFVAAAGVLAAVAAITVAVFLVLRALAGFVFSTIGGFARGAETGSGVLMRRGLAIVLGIGLDAVIVLLAANAGYLAGLYAFGENGAIGTQESLFINAFALIELAKVAIRAVFAARYETLRLARIAGETAAWWSIRLRWFVGVVGYVMLVAVPIANAQLSYFVGAIVTFLVIGGAYGYALGVIFYNRRLFTQRLRQMGDNASIGFFSVLYRVFARLWLILAVAYFTVLFGVSQADPTGALPFMLSATLQSVAAAAVGFGLSGLLSLAIGKRVAFSPGVRESLPMLEHRVNSYVPNALKVIRVVILVLVLAVVGNAWKLFDLGGWLASDAGLAVVGIGVRVAIVLVGAVLLWLITASVIEHRLSPNTGAGVPSARQQTLLVLFRNILAIAIATFTLMIVLAQIGVNIGPLIAGAGVFGLAIGFGAQKLVQDIITGVFIQLENAMNTGDVVSVGGVTGTAERLTIRSVSIRDLDGAYHIVPFSSASVVTNYMREWAYFRTEYGIAYREDIDNAVAHIRDAFKALKADPATRANILEDIAVPGVTALNDSSVSIRIMIKTKPGTQWGVGRAFNRLVKMHFDRAGIEIPFPHQTVYFGEDREGSAPPANLRILDTSAAADTPARKKQRRGGDDSAPEETGDAPPDV